MTGVRSSIYTYLSTYIYIYTSAWTPQPSGFAWPIHCRLSPFIYLFVRAYQTISLCTYLFPPAYLSLSLSLSLFLSDQPQRQLHQSKSPKSEQSKHTLLRLCHSDFQPSEPTSPTKNQVFDQLLLPPQDLGTADMIPDLPSRYGLLLLLVTMIN